MKVWQAGSPRTPQQLHGLEKLQRKSEEIPSVRESTPRLEPLLGEGEGDGRFGRRRGNGYTFLSQG